MMAGTIRHGAFLAFAGIAAVMGLLASRADAQPLVATTGIVSDACVNPPQGGCTTATLYVVNGDTLQIQASMELWRGLPNSTVRKLVAHPGGTLLYAAQSDSALAPTSRWIDVIDLRTLTKVTTYNAAGDLMAIAADGRRLYLTTPTAVLVVDSASGAVLASVPVDSPHGIGAAAGRGRLYVAGGSAPPFSITILDSATYALVQTIQVQHFVSQVQVTADEAHVYALAPTSRVFDIDAATNTVAGEITYFGGPTSPNALTFAGGRAYVATSFQSPGVTSGEGMAVIDVATRGFVTRIPVLDPIFAEASTDGRRVWTATLGEPRIITIDTATNQRIGSVTVPGGPLYLAAIPVTRTAQMFIDRPAAASTVFQPFALSGWAVDVQGLLPGPGVDTVHVWAYPTFGGAPTFVGANYGHARPDVGALFGPTFSNSGFHVVVRGLTPGGYQLVAFGHSTRTGEFSIVRSVPVTIASRSWLVLDTPASGSALQPRFAVAGWAADPGAETGTGIDAIHVWAYPSAGGAPLFVGAAMLGDARPDVGQFLGAQFANAGFHLEASGLSPGTYDLVAYGHSTVTGAFSVEQHVTVTIAAPVPLMFVDTPAPDAVVGGTFVISGWAVEYNSTAGTGVDLIHVWATSSTGSATFVGAATYGLDRPDVGAWLGPQYAASGFALTASLPAGTYTLSVYARSAATGAFQTVRTVAIVVQ